MLLWAVAIYRLFKGSVSLHAVGESVDGAARHDSEVIGAARCGQLLIVNGTILACR